MAAPSGQTAANDLKRLTLSTRPCNACSLKQDSFSLLLCEVTGGGKTAGCEGRSVQLVGKTRTFWHYCAGSDFG
jgi:hypothetical protein